MRKITILTLGNGYLVVNKSGEEPSYLCVEEQEDESEVEAFARLLWILNDMIGPETSRYSPKRLRIDTEPGDKYGDGTELSNRAVTEPRAGEGYEGSDSRADKDGGVVDKVFSGRGIQISCANYEALGSGPINNYAQTGTVYS